MEANKKEEEREALEALPSTLFIFVADKPIMEFKSKGKTIYLEHHGYTFVIKLIDTSVILEEWKWKIIRGSEHCSKEEWDSLEDAIKDIIRGIESHACK